MDANQQTVQLLFEEAIAFDEPYTAHLIYFAWRKGKVTRQDPVEKLYKMTMTEKEHKELKDILGADTLNMRPHKLYAIKRNTRTYVFYFASNAWDARKLHFELYGKWENRIIYAYNQLMDKGLYFPHTNCTKTFRQLLEETVEFPRWICEMER